MAVRTGKTRKRRASSDDEPVRRKRSSSSTRTKASSSRTSDVIKVDFRKEEGGGGGGARVKEGDYRVKIVAMKHGRSSDKDTPYIQVDLKIMDDGKYKSKVISDRLYMTPKSLFRVRSLLEALGLTVPKKVVAIPVKKLIGKELGVTAVDDEYEGRIRSRVGDFIDLETLEDMDDDDDLDDEDEDLDEDDDEDEEDDEDEDDDDDDEEDEDDDDEDLEDLDLDDI